MAMGRRAGAGLVVGVRTGIGTDADLAAADVIVDSVADLEGVLG
jgi:phosphoglycolate phosphatase-like HAD superfamily hydrolase